MPHPTTNPTTNRTAGGLSLVELLVTLAISAILLLSAWPALDALLDEYRVSQAADRLAASLALARTTAAARRTEVRLSPAASAATLDRGWQLAEVAPGAGPDRPPFSVVRLPDRCLRVAMRGTAGAGGPQSLRLTAVGYSRSERGGFFAATFHLRCHAAQRQVRLGAQGRIRTCRPAVDPDCDPLPTIPTDPAVPAAR
ncbi:GspH/FimT family pseudopilin [Cupriavidus agavae]|uniref:Type II secretion system protein H n=1 Tax=Cupriavidus agavae TaxID=1001822 RepID=A0A4Q7S6A1_9BURK|nr:GspH/FimT family pseudopilin [Cupriavidus agavae]RZT41387.1 type IV fimbrial biogenesis protein FimT [Cupriavidus agavae]